MPETGGLDPLPLPEGIRGRGAGSKESLGEKVTWMGKSTWVAAPSPESPPLPLFGAMMDR